MEMKIYSRIFLSIFTLTVFASTIGSCAKQQSSPEIVEEIIDNNIETKDSMDDANVLKIIAVLTIKDEKDSEDIEKALMAVVDGTRTEEGNISYELHQDVNNPLVYVFIEVWESQQAIDIHNGTPHFRAFTEAIKGKVGLTVNVVRKIY